MDTKTNAHQMNRPPNKQAAYSWAEQISYKQVKATKNCMITKLVLVCTLLQLFSKHAIKVESISFQVKQFVSILQKIQFSNLHSLIIITSNTKCDCGLHYTFTQNLFGVYLFGQIVCHPIICPYFSGALLSGAHLSEAHSSENH